MAPFTFLLMYQYTSVRSFFTSHLHLLIYTNSWNSFPFPMTVGGWVGLNGWLHIMNSQSSQ